MIFTNPQKITVLNIIADALVTDGVMDQNDPRFPALQRSVFASLVAVPTHYPALAIAQFLVNHSTVKICACEKIADRVWQLMDKRSDLTVISRVEMIEWVRRKIGQATDRNDFPMINAIIRELEAPTYTLDNLPSGYSISKNGLAIGLVERHNDFTDQEKLLTEMIAAANQ